MADLQTRIFVGSDADDATAQLNTALTDDDWPLVRWQGYTGTKLHGCLCDPPYSLGDGTRGFMGARWDTSIAFKPETWKALAQESR